MICDFCKEEYIGDHLCSCKECNKKHPICNECFDHYISTGKIIVRGDYGELDSLV